MKFTITKELLESTLQSVVGVVERRQTLPILGNVLIRAEAKKLVMVATDLEVEIHQTIDNVCDQAGEITVPARKLYDICRSLPSASNISISTKGEQLEVKAGRSRFSLSTLPARDFPQADEIQPLFEISLPERALRGLMENTQFCMAQQDVRYYLNGLMLEFRASGLRAVATDGHRLGLCDWSQALSAPDLPRQVIVPRKAVGEMLRLMEERDDPLTLSIGSNHIRVRLGDIIFTSKLIDGRFPDYERVLPKTEGGQLVTADKEDLKAALSRAAILSNEKFKGIRLGLAAKTMSIQAHNPEHEAAEDEVEISYQGPDMEVGFNVAYLLDALNGLSTEKACMVVSDPNSSCLITEPDSTSKQYVVMPMRL
jgi:DNA polymerase-3 subunit beta